MKRSPPWGAALLSCALFTATAHAVEATEPLNTLYDYETPQTGWAIWVPAANGYTVNQNGVTPGNSPTTSGSKSYVIEVELTTSPYVYFYIDNPHSLFGDINLTANIKVEVVVGTAADARVSLGYRVDYPGAGLNGMTTNPYHADLKTSDWQTIGGNISDYLITHRSDVAKLFALSEADDLLPYTQGPVLYLFNDGAAANRPLTLRITLDDVHIQGTVAPYAGYQEAAVTAADDYISRAQPLLEALFDDAQTTYQTIDNLPLNASAPLHNRLKAEALLAWQSQQAIAATAAARTERLKVPTSEQYVQQRNNLETLGALLDLGQAVLAAPSETFIHYAWQATGAKKHNDMTLAAGTALQQPVAAAMALGEYEPLSFILQNLDANDTVVSGITVDLTNQFGQIFPAARIDARVVKNWYTGSATSIVASGAIEQVRVPELLLKDDALVITDDDEGKNYLRITSGGLPSYRDISSPTVLMPNDAEASDSATLQPFTIPEFRSKQVWLTLDSTEDVEPGNYQGHIVVTYRNSGSAVDQHLYIATSLVVLPRWLDDSSLRYSIYYLGRISTNHGLKSDLKSEPQYLAELNNLKSHGVMYPTQYLYDNHQSLATYVALREQLSLPCDKYYVHAGLEAVGIDPVEAYDNAIELKSVLAASSSCANSELYIYALDEKKDDELDAQRNAWISVHNAGAKVFVAGYSGTFARVGDLLDTLVLNGKPDPLEIAAWRGAGKDVYSYDNPQVGVPDPYTYRYNFGLLLWQHDYTGAMNYAYQDMFPGTSSTRGDLSGGECQTSTTHYCSAWNDFDSSWYFDHMFTYPTSNGVVDTVQWEGFREAIDDNRYLATLQAEMAKVADAQLAADLAGWIAGKKAETNLDPLTMRAEMQYLLAGLLHGNNQPPQISTTNHVTGGGTLIVIGDVSDPEDFLVDVSVKVGSGPWQAAHLEDGQWAAWFTGLSAGTHTVHYRAKDYYGVATTGETDFTVAP